MTTLTDNARLAQTSGMTRRTAIIQSITLDGFDDEYAGNPDWGDGMIRVGRHILYWDNRGFYTLESWEDAMIGEAMFREIANDLYPETDDD